QPEHAAGKQHAQGFANVLGRGNQAQIQQAVVDARVRAQGDPAAGLTAVADPQGQEVALPVEAGPLEMPEGAAHLGEAGQAGQQVGGAAQQLLQVVGGAGGDLAAEAAGGHVDEQALVGRADVHGGGGQIQQGQGGVGLQRNPR